MNTLISTMPAVAGPSWPEVVTLVAMFAFFAFALWLLMRDERR